MTFPRVAAAIFVFVLIGSLALASLIWLRPSMAHGPNVQSAHGTIKRIGPGKDFDFETAPGKVMHFQCTEACRASLDHMQRHLVEHAPTDVYFEYGANHLLVAIDVD